MQLLKLITDKYINGGIKIVSVQLCHFIANGFVKCICPLSYHYFIKQSMLSHQGDERESLIKLLKCIHSSRITPPSH